jgi:hypothetical protein
MSCGFATVSARRAELSLPDVWCTAGSLSRAAAGATEPEPPIASATGAAARRVGQAYQTAPHL